MKHYIIALLSPGNSYTKYKIWVAISLIIQAVSTLVPPMLIRGATVSQEYFLYGSLSLAVISILITVTSWQKWIAYGIAIYGLLLCLILVVFNLTNTGMLLYLLAWSMSVSLGYGREMYNLKWFFGFMSVVLVFFATGLFFAHSTQYTDIERALSILSGTFIIAVNIFLWSKEAKMSSNHYSERRQKYEDIASLSEKMTSILTHEKEAKIALQKIAIESVPGLHLDYCMIFLLEGDSILSLDGKEQLKVEKSTLVGAAFIDKEVKVIADSSLSNFKQLNSFSGARSEIAAPFFNNGNIAGVIYGASTKKDILRERHEQAFQVIASFCGLKLSQEDAEESIREAERTKAEVDQYRQLDELKNRFIANISHDLKTPLSLIKGPAKQIAQITEDKKIRSLTGYIINNADHLLRVVHQLLQLNRVEKGINELYFQHVDLNNLCKKIKGQYEERANSKGVHLEVLSEEIHFLTDAFRLEQIIHNLLSNAIRYTDAGGKITIEVKIEGETLVCKVSDTGTGIPEEYQRKVFDRFFKVDENNQEGTGIGLSLVQEYVQLLEGTIQMKSEPGKGTSFTLRFPLTHSASIDNNSEKLIGHHVSEIETSGKPHMLVVEDHADLNQFIVSFFEEKFTTVSAFDGEEALERIRQNMPDIIVTDIMMPRLDGKSLVEEIRSNEDWAHIPIIVLSAKSQSNNKIEMYQSGVDNFLSKPFDIEELEAVVNTTLKQRKNLRDSFRKNYLNADTLLNQMNGNSDFETPEVVDASGLLQDLKDYILEHLDDSDLSINEIAQKLGLGRNRFQKEIKDLTGVTPVEFVRSFRLNEAFKMLGDKSRNVSEVAYAVGFSNLSYFTRSFKQEFGILPSEVA